MTVVLSKVVPHYHFACHKSHVDYWQLSLWAVACPTVYVIVVSNLK